MNDYQAIIEKKLSKYSELFLVTIIGAVVIGFVGTVTIAAMDIKIEREIQRMEILTDENGVIYPDIRIGEVTRTVKSSLGEILPYPLIGFILATVFSLAMIFVLVRIWTCPNCQSRLVYVNHFPKKTNYCPNCGIQFYPEDQTDT
jgi:multisubunit Na+/H+ antiporter MnhF subunit